METPYEYEGNEQPNTAGSGEKGRSQSIHKVLTIQALSQKLAESQQERAAQREKIRLLESLNNTLRAGLNINITNIIQESIDANNVLFEKIAKHKILVEQINAAAIVAIECAEKIELVFNESSVASIENDMCNSSKNSSSRVSLTTKTTTKSVLIGKANSLSFTTLNHASAVANTEILSGIPLFNEFPANVMERLSQFCYEVRREAGEVVVKKGDQSQEIFLVVDGAVSILNGHGQAVSSLYSGNFFGELGFLFNCNRTATVVAKEDCRLILLTIQKIREAVNEFPALTLRLEEFIKSKEDWYVKQNYTIDDDFGGEFILSIARSRLKELAVCKDVDNLFIEELAMTVVGEVYHANEMIINIDDNSDCMYFIMKGEVEVVDRSGKIHAEMIDGSSFGEVGIMYQMKRTASIRSKGDSILIKLNVSDLQRCLQKYPLLKENVDRQAAERHHLWQERSDVKKSVVELFDVEISVFSNFDDRILHQIAMGMTHKRWSKGECIITAGEQAKSMFFLALGTVEIISDFDQVVDTSGPNSWFGEVGILQDVPRIATIRALTECFVYEFSRALLLELMEKYSELKVKIEETSKERLQAHLMRSILA